MTDVPYDNWHLYYLTSNYFPFLDKEDLMCATEMLMGSERDREEFIKQILENIAKDRCLANRISYNVAKDFVKPILKRSNIAHYTSVKAALSILETREFWLNRYNTSNDTGEVDYGKDIFEPQVSNLIAEYKQCLEYFEPDNKLISEENLKKEIDDYLSNVYFMCFSKHYNEEGNYAQWRLYAKEHSCYDLK